MTTIEQFITPGIEGVQAGYDSLRTLGVDAPTAAEWLTEHVQTVVRDDLTALAAPHGRAIETGVTFTENRRIRHALRVAVKVYNRQRPRLTEFDVKTAHLFTKGGAAAVNRAAVQREMSAPKEAVAFLGRANSQAVIGVTAVGGFQVAGRLHIPAVGLRAFVAYYKARAPKPAGHDAHASIRLHDFQVIH